MFRLIYVQEKAVIAMNFVDIFSIPERNMASEVAATG